MACENKTTIMEVPKFDNTMDVATYLELFEAVMTQNQEDQTAWVLFLRASVLKSKLADAIGMEDFGNYAQVKSEILATSGQRHPVHDGARCTKRSKAKRPFVNMH